jgi:hypothetical protein
MKKLLLIILVAFVSLPVMSQDEEPVRDSKARAKIDAARAAYITERLGLTPDEAQKFWPVYNEFAQKREGMRKDYIQARKQGVEDKALVEMGLKIKQQELDLEKEYSGRMMNIITPQKLMNLRQAEGEFRQIIIKQIQQRQQNADRQRQLRDRNQKQLQQRNN